VLHVTEGAVAPGEVIDLTFGGISGVDYTADAWAIVCELVTQKGVRTPLTPWTTIVETEDSITVRFSPTGTEFVALGSFSLVPEIVVDIDRYRFESVSGTIVKRF
jgi:hypothetical protein